MRSKCFFIQIVVLLVKVNMENDSEPKPTPNFKGFFVSSESLYNMQTTNLIFDRKSGGIKVK